MASQTVLNELNETLAQLNNELKDLDQQLTNAEQQRDLFEYSCTDDEFNEHLDNCYDEVEICGYSYSASQALYDVDPTAWRCAKNDYESNYDLDDCDEYQEILETIEELENQISDKESEIIDFTGCESSLDCVFREACEIMNSVYYSERNEIISDLLDELQD